MNKVEEAISNLQGEGRREGGGMYRFLLGPTYQAVMATLQLPWGLTYAHSASVSEGFTHTLPHRSFRLLWLCFLKCHKSREGRAGQP